MVIFTMNAFNKGRRWTHVMGTKGEIHAAMDGESPIQLYDFESKDTVSYGMNELDGILGGHGGGDEGIILDL